MLTTRKGNKRFGFYDLNVSLEWEATPVPAAATAAAAEALAGSSLECAAGEGAGEKAQPASGGDNVEAAGGATDGHAAAAPAGGQKEADGKQEEEEAAAVVVVSGTMDVKEFGSVRSCGLLCSEDLPTAQG